MRVALIGFGSWGKNYVSAVLETRFAKITTVLVRDKKKIDGTNWPGIEFTEDLDKVDCDAAIIATHPSASIGFAEHFLYRQIPVMIEKPAGLLVSEAKRLLDLESLNPVPILVAHQHLFSSVFQELKIQIQDEKLRKIEAESGNQGPFRDYSFVWDYAPHDLSLIFGLTDPCARLDVIGVHLENQLVGECEISLLVDMDVEARIRIWNSHLPKTRRLKVETTKNLYIYDDQLSPDALIKGGELKRVEYRKPLSVAVSEFLKAVRNSGTSDYRFGARWAMLTACAIEKIIREAKQNMT